MTAEEAARDWLTASGVTYDKHDVRSLTALLEARERAARVEALRGAAESVRRKAVEMRAGAVVVESMRRGDPPAIRAAAKEADGFADWLSARAEDEERT